jgi:hypothetical protein
MRGVLDAMHEEGIPADVIEQIRKVLDCNVYFFEKKVSVPIMYAVLGGAVFLLILIYVFMNVIKLKKAIKR